MFLTKKALIKAVLVVLLFLQISPQSFQGGRAEMHFREPINTSRQEIEIAWRLHFPAHGFLNFRFQCFNSLFHNEHKDTAFLLSCSYNLAFIELGPKWTNENFALMNILASK